MKSQGKWRCLVLLVLALAGLAFGQENRGLKVVYKDVAGRKQEEQLYKKSYALLIGVCNYMLAPKINDSKSARINESGYAKKQGRRGSMQRPCQVRKWVRTKISYPLCTLSRRC